MKIEVSYESKLDKKLQYVVCPNHFSYLDIPTMGLLNINTIFVGKSDMEKIPLFGWMYKRLHITVNRDSLKSKYSTFISSMEALKEGKSIVIYPEGGIVSKSAPKMGRFKDGAFKVAVNTQLPIVPVSIVNNWIILPDNLLMRLRKQKVIVHAPISTEGKTESDIAELKRKVWETIDKTIDV